MPDNVFKSDEVKDDATELTINELGPEEKFAGNVLKSLKTQISEARETVNELEEKIENKKKEAEEKRDEIIQEARDEADQILDEARDEANQLINSKEEELENAREEGYEDGYQDGETDAESDMAELVEQARTILSEAKRERDAFLAERSEEIASIAGEIAEEIVRDTVQFDESVIKRVIQSALDEIREVQEITIVLNPDDVAIIGDIIDDYVEEHANLQDINLSEDRRMDRGGCRIHTSFGDLDGTIKGQIEHLNESLIEALESIEKVPEQNE